MENGEYDARARPKRGVHVKGLPFHMLPEFRVFCSELRTHAQSHISTWRLAKREVDHDIVDKQLAYWRSALKYINTIEYLGTTANDPSRLSRGHKAKRRRTS